MKNNNKKLSGKEGFEIYYDGLFGKRWNDLRNSLLEPVRQYEYTGGLLKPYFLDCGSVAAGFSLPGFPEEEEEKGGLILDMCAAPGGKSLVLSRMLINDNFKMIANEKSGERKTRLCRVLDEHLPSHVRNRITVTGKDAALWCRNERNAFDRILIDAPCSSERHVISSPYHLSLWTPARIRNLTYTQWSILSSGYLALKPGGYLLYSTCALAADENDGVVGRLLKKYSEARLCTSRIPSSVSNLLGVVEEKTKYGVQILPDKSSGAGPLFYSLITKPEN